MQALVNWSQYPIKANPEGIANANERRMTSKGPGRVQLERQQQINSLTIVSALDAGSGGDHASGRDRIADSLQIIDLRFRQATIGCQNEMFIVVVQVMRKDHSWLQVANLHLDRSLGLEIGQ